MAPEPIKTDSTLTQGEKQKLLDHEIREMISALTHRLSDVQLVHKQTSSSHHSHNQAEDHYDHEDSDDDNGVRIITLAGSNTGAAMRGELQEQDNKYSSLHGSAGAGENGNENENEAALALGTYVNSNIQAINNSIMLGGSYSTNDPGVHLDISSDHLQQEHDGHVMKHAAHGNYKVPKAKGKKKEKETSKSIDQLSESSE